ncbi:MAG: HD-GYP domain-containing protein [Planctomycetota bacterium]
MPASTPAIDPTAQPAGTPPAARNAAHWAPGDGANAARVADAVARLDRVFRQSFSVIDLGAGRLERVSSDWLGGDLFSRLPLCEQVAQRGEVEVIEDCAPLLVLAVPLHVDGEKSEFLAVSTFLTQPVAEPRDIAAAARVLGVDADHALVWSRGRAPWPPHAVIELAKAWLQNEAGAQEQAQLRDQLTDVSSHLLSTFEELSMLHRLTERLSLSSSETELCSLSLQWLADIVPAESLAILLQPSESLHGGQERPTTEVLTTGKPPLEEDEYGRFVELLGPEAPNRCLVLNRDRTDSPTWCYPAVRELISVPIRAGSRQLGWMLALNFRPGGGADTEFGTIEASLLSSVAAILGVHSGNTGLYREQSEFFESVIRALSSSIDAKDPYTCGHSDRVARISVCLARELGCPPDDLNTIYLSGLLHDIGKIGIDDNVLRKPGKLTTEEYEHIKTHPELGYRILAGVKQLDKVLPVVLHHHEAWDGSGYPMGLVGEECPELARIVAVADSIDAMGSDRPYRKGMPAEKLDEILRAGAGRQWDARVVDAFFTAREEVRQIAATERASLALDVQEWAEAPAVGAETETEETAAAQPAPPAVASSAPVASGAAQDKPSDAASDAAPNATGDAAGRG